MKTKRGRIKIMIRILLILSGLFMLFWYMCPLVAHIFNIGNAAGIAGSALLVLAGVFLNQLAQLADKMQGHQATKVILYGVLTLIGVGVLSVFAIYFSMLEANHNEPKKNETVVVLGCSVKGDNPSLMLRHRINAAAEYLNDNPESVAVLSGGQGPGENMTEAECMKRELLKKGISENRLIKEELSTNTYENIENSFAALEEHGVDKSSVVIVTSDYHQKRASMICKEFGSGASAISAKTDFYSYATFWTREILGIIKEFLF